MRNPELKKLCGSDICGMTVHQDRSYAEVLLLVDSQNVFSVHLSNEDGSPLKFKIGELDLRLITEEESNWVTLGEFEYYHEDPDGWIHFEGDSGLFSFLCSQVKINKRYNNTAHQSITAP